MNNKKRISTFLKLFVVFLIIALIPQYYKGSNGDYFTAISVALGMSLGITFHDKFKLNYKKERT